MDTTDLTSMTVKDLRCIAQQHNVKGRWKMKKEDLIIAIRTSILNAIPTLTSTPFVKQIREYRDDLKVAVNETADWILNHIPEQPKKIVNEKLEALKNTVNKLFKKYELRESKSALKGFSKQHTIEGWFGIDLESFLKDVQPSVMSFLSRNRQTKVYIIAKCVMERVNSDGDVINQNVPFPAKSVINLEGTNLHDLYDKARGSILEHISTFQQQGSNWRFKEVLQLDVNTVEYKPLKGNSYIKLPDVLAKKKAIVNMKNEDDECFKWCITRALNPVEKNQECATKSL